MIFLNVSTIDGIMCFQNCFRERALMVGFLSPSIHKYDNVFIYSGLSAE